MAPLKSAPNEMRAAWSRSLNLLGFSFFFSIFTNILMLTGPLFMLQVYDRVLGSGSQETLVALILLVAALYGLLWLLELARSRLLARFGARIQSEMDERVFKSVLSRTNSQPEAISATRDLDVVQSFYASPTLVAMMDAPFTPLFVAAIFIFHPLLGWLAVAGSLVLIGLTTLNQVLTRRQIREAQTKTAIAHRFADNTRLAGELIRSQAMLGSVTDRWIETRRVALCHSMKVADWTGGFATFTKAFRLFLQSLILALGAWLVLQAELTAGAMIASSILLGRALAPVEQLLSRWPQVVQARQSWASLSRFLEMAPTPIRRTRLPRPVGRISAKGLTVSGGPGAPALLYNVSFALEPGEVLGIIGRSGSGKSTIARALLNQVSLTVGEVRLGDALLTQYEQEELGQYIGYLPQDTLLITGTIAENIARMSRHPNSAAVVAAAQKACAHELILSLPNGYETRVEDNKIGLSGGQKQRIALARALYGDPVLLVLDEPNSALDQDGTDALNSAIRAMKSEGRCVVIMTHRPLAISECDRLMVLDAGAIKAIGPRDTVLKAMMRNAGDIQHTFARGTA